MKHALLITAYKDIQQLIDMVEFFDDDFSFYIHIKKTSQVDLSLLDRLKNSRKVAFVSRKYDVHWGGHNFLKVILHLCEEALEDQSIQYFHLLSGQDFPIKDSKTFKDLFSAEKGKQFIEFVTPPGSKFLKRLRHYYLFDIFDVKNKNGWPNINRALRLQYKLKLKRPEIKLPNVAVGSAWWSLSYDCLRYVMDYTKHQPYLVSRLKHTWCPEEFYFQTVLLNSPFRDQITNNNLRYIDWEVRNGSSPAILDENDFEELVQCPKLFARKFESPVSTSLIRKLKNQFAPALFEKNT